MFEIDCWPGHQKDMDIVCVGSGIELAQNVAFKLLPRPRVTVYKRFGTAMIKHNGLEIEFVGARQNPIVMTLASQPLRQAPWKMIRIEEILLSMPWP